MYNMYNMTTIKSFIITVKYMFSLVYKIFFPPPPIEILSNIGT